MPAQDNLARAHHWRAPLGDDPPENERPGAEGTGARQSFGGDDRVSSPLIDDEQDAPEGSSTDPSDESGPERAMGVNLDVALDLARRGVATFPVQAGGPNVKKPWPFFKWKAESSTDEKVIREWWRKHPDSVPAIDLGKARLLVIDADRHDPKHDGVLAWAALVEAHGCPDGPRVTTPNDGCHIVFRQDGSFGNSRGALPKGVDVRGSGGYIVAPGAVLADGRRYECSGDLADAPSMPAWLIEQIRAGRQAEPQPSPENVRTGSPPPFSSNAPSATSSAEMNEMLSHIPPDILYDDWLRVLMAVHSMTGGSSAGLSLADEWSARGAKYKKGEVARKWRSFRREGINGPTLAAIARQHGADLSAIRLRHMPGAAERASNIALGAANAKRLRATFQGTLHDPETGEVADPTAEEPQPDPDPDPEPEAPEPEEEPEPGPESDASTSERETRIDYPDGLVGDIARWIVATSWKPQPALAIAAALTIVGAAAGRQFMGPTSAGTALYVLGLAPTGQGKDMPLKQVRRILNAAGMGKHLGPDEFMSFSAVVNLMTRQALALCPMDEFGDFMRRIYDRKGSTHARAIPKVLRTLWGANFDEVGTAEWAGKEYTPFKAPHLSIFAASTHEQFYAALEGGAIDDGTLNRFLIIEGETRPPKVKPIADQYVVPEEIVDGVRRVFLNCGNDEFARDLAAIQRNDPLLNPAEHNFVMKLGWAADGAEAEFDAFAEDVEDRMFAEPQNVAFLARAVEMAVRIATIVAAGCGRDAVALSDVRYGVEVVKQSVDMMIAGAADYMAETENEANWQKVKRLIRNAGGSMVYRDIQSKMRRMKGRDLRELLSSMCEAEVLGWEETPVHRPQGGGHPVVVYHLLRR